MLSWNLLSILYMMLTLKFLCWFGKESLFASIKISRDQFDVILNYSICVFIDNPWDIYLKINFIKKQPMQRRGTRKTPTLEFKENFNIKAPIMHAKGSRITNFSKRFKIKQKIYSSHHPPTNQYITLSFSVSSSLLCELIYLTLENTWGTFSFPLRPQCKSNDTFNFQLKFNLYAFPT